jgi:hypothetical protein
MKVPALSWPPRWFNQGAQYFVGIQAAGAIVVKSPGVVSVTRTGVGVYEIVFSKPEPLLVPIVSVANHFYSQAVLNPTTTQITINDPALNPADVDFAVIFYNVPFSWLPTP